MDRRLEWYFKTKFLLRPDPRHGINYTVVVQRLQEENEKFKHRFILPIYSLSHHLPR